MDKKTNHRLWENICKTGNQQGAYIQNILIPKEETSYKSISKSNNPKARWLETGTRTSQKMLGMWKKNEWKASQIISYQRNAN